MSSRRQRRCLRYQGRKTSFVDAYSRPVVCGRSAGESSAATTATNGDQEEAQLGAGVARSGAGHGEQGWATNPSHYGHPFIRLATDTAETTSTPRS